MSNVKAPLLSFDAGGQIAKSLVFAKWKGRPYVRQYVIPSNPNSAAQQLTRNTFRFLSALWSYMPAGSIGAWELYAANSRFTPTNGFMKKNVGPLRDQTDLLLMTVSTAANSGIIAEDITLTPASGQITVDLTAPSLPAGWTITQAHAVAIRNVDPQTEEIYDVVGGSDASAPYSIVLSGLTDGEEYVVGGWFEYTRSNGDTAYGASLQDTATPA